jgi:NTP pyrophosphatase (non-canonical NTP hydrolase)
MSKALADLEEIIGGRRAKLASGKNRRRFLALALCGESGELANVVKKQWRDGKDRTKKARAELCDVLAYGLMLGNDLGWSVSDTLAAVVRKLRAVERRKSFKQWHR